MHQLGRPKRLVSEWGRGNYGRIGRGATDHKQDPLQPGGRRVWQSMELADPFSSRACLYLSAVDEKWWKRMSFTRLFIASLIAISFFSTLTPMVRSWVNLGDCPRYAA